MAYQDTSLILASRSRTTSTSRPRPDQRPPFWQRKRWARRVLREFDLDLELFPDAPAGMLTLAERQLFEVAKALVDRAEGAPARRAHDRARPQRGRSAPPHRRRLPATRRRRRVREPPSSRGPRDRRSHHRPAGRPAPGDVRRRGTTSKSELVDLIVGPAVRGGVPAAAAEPARPGEVARRRRPAGPVLRARELHAAERRDRRDRRRRGQRATPALRLPRGPPAAEGRVAWSATART